MVSSKVWKKLQGLHEKSPALYLNNSELLNLSKKPDQRDISPLVWLFKLMVSNHFIDDFIDIKIAWVVGWPIFHFFQHCIN